MPKIDDLLEDIDKELNKMFYIRFGPSEKYWTMKITEQHLELQRQIHSELELINMQKHCIRKKKTDIKKILNKMCNLVFTETKMLFKEIDLTEERQNTLEDTNTEKRTVSNSQEVFSICENNKTALAAAYTTALSDSFKEQSSPPLEKKSSPSPLIKKNEEDPLLSLEQTPSEDTDRNSPILLKDEKTPLTLIDSENCDEDADIHKIMYVSHETDTAPLCVKKDDVPSLSEDEKNRQISSKNDISTLFVAEKKDETALSDVSNNDISSLLVENENEEAHLAPLNETSSALEKNEKPSHSVCSSKKDISSTLVQSEKNECELQKILNFRSEEEVSPKEEKQHATYSHPKQKLPVRNSEETQEDCEPDKCHHVCAWSKKEAELLEQYKHECETHKETEKTLRQQLESVKKNILPKYEQLIDLHEKKAKEYVDLIETEKKKSSLLHEEETVSRLEEVLAAQASQEEEKKQLISTIEEKSLALARYEALLLTKRLSTLYIIECKNILNVINAIFQRTFGSGSIEDDVRAHEKMRFVEQEEPNSNDSSCITHKTLLSVARRYVIDYIKLRRMFTDLYTNK